MNASPNTCKEVLANISGYLDGELDAAACDAIERHCRECADCATLVDSLRQTVGLCRQAGQTPLPDAVRQRALERVRDLLERESRKS
jgi:anti-sigma factor RsiW